MVMTGCLLVYAALEYRIRTALKEYGATFPDQRQTHSEPRPHAGCSTTSWGFMCSPSQDKAS